MSEKDKPLGSELINTIIKKAAGVNVSMGLGIGSMEVQKPTVTENAVIIAGLKDAKELNPGEIVFSSFNAGSIETCEPNADEKRIIEIGLLEARKFRIID